MNSNQKLIFFTVALAIAGVGFVVGQGKEGAGVPVVIFLSTVWTIYSVRRWGKVAAD